MSKAAVTDQPLVTAEVVEEEAGEGDSDYKWEDVPASSPNAPLMRRRVLKVKPTPLQINLGTIGNYRRALKILEDIVSPAGYKRRPCIISVVGKHFRFTKWFMKQFGYSRSKTHADVDAADGQTCRKYVCDRMPTAKKLPGIAYLAVNASFGPLYDQPSGFGHVAAIMRSSRGETHLLPNLLLDFFPKPEKKSSLLRTIPARKHYMINVIDMGRYKSDKMWGHWAASLFLEHLRVTSAYPPSDYRFLDPETIFVVSVSVFTRWFMWQFGYKATDCVVVANSGFIFRRYVRCSCEAEGEEEEEEEEECDGE